MYEGNEQARLEQLVGMGNRGGKEGDGRRVTVLTSKVLTAWAWLPA